MIKVLVVDDDDLVRPTVSAMLREIDLEVSETSSGKNALALLSLNTFDLIVTDLFMPDFDGIELILRIRDLTSDTPIVLMTGGGRLFPPGSDGLDNLTTSAEYLGASYIIYKPFRKRELSELVMKALS